MNTNDAEKIVPKGMYCYTIVKIKKDKETGRPIIKTKPCKYFSNNGFCALMQEEVEDQVKVCTINL